MKGEGFLLFFVFEQVGAEMGGLLSFQSVDYLLRLCGVCNHPDGIVVAHVFPEPVEQHHHLVLYAEDAAQVNHQPEHPGEEALAMELADFNHSLVSAHCRHRTQVLVAEWLEGGINLPKSISNCNLHSVRGSC